MMMHGLILLFWFSCCLFISITDIIENTERHEVYPIHLLKYEVVRDIKVL